MSGYKDMRKKLEEPGESIPSQVWEERFLTWWDLGKRVWSVSQQHDIMGRAAQLGFYFLLSLFPALICLTALVGMLPIQSVLPQMMVDFQKVLPSESLSLVDEYLKQVVQGTGGGIFSLSLLGALVAASWGMMAIIDTLNTVYNVKETRPIWKFGGMAVLLTIGAAVFAIVSMTLILIGEYLSQWIADVVGFSGLFTFGWTLLQWPVTFFFMLLAISLIYYWAPNIKHEWHWVTPGSVLAVVLWIFVSLGFKFYAENLMNYNVVYGSITGVIVLMMWLYFSGLVLLIGGELNAILESHKTE